LNSKGHPSGCAGLSLEQAVEVAEGVMPRELDSPDQVPPKYRQPWPTPTVHGNNNRKGLSAKSGDGLGTAVRNHPTPTARDWRSGAASEATHAKNSRPLNEHVAASEANGPPTQPTTLNPEWVEWLMGFPIGWTDLSEGG